MGDGQNPERFLQPRDALCLNARNPMATRVIELMEPCEILHPDNPIDLRAYGRILRKRASTILVVSLLVFSIAALATLKQRPVYRAQMVLDIQKENPEIPTIQELYALESVSETYLRTQYSILRSESLARHVVDELHLDALPEFNARRWWSWPRRREPEPQTPVVGSLLSGQRRDDYQRVLERFQEHLDVEPVNHSRLVAVSFESRDANLAARVVNTVATNFIQENLQARWSAAQNAADWLSQQLSTVKGKLEKSENEQIGRAHV